MRRGYAIPAIVFVIGLSWALPTFWIASAPAAAFTPLDLARPAEITTEDIRSFVRGCVRSAQSPYSSERDADMCLCRADALARQTNRAEFLYASHLLREEMRAAYSITKGLIAAGVPKSEVDLVGTRTASVIKGARTSCFLKSLTPADMGRIRRSLDQQGFTPRNLPR